MARALISLILIGVLGSAALADVFADVYRADEETPLALVDPNTDGFYEDIMVGTRLAVFITSDTPGIWDGQLWLSPEAATVGAIFGRGYNPKSPSRNHEGSCLKAAGRNPLVSIHTGPDGVAVALLSAWDATAGEWFVLDYEARAVGTCEIEFYSLDVSDDVLNNANPYIDDPPSFDLHLIQAFTFNHVPTRDLDDNRVVDFADFALLAAGFTGARAVDPNEHRLHDLNADDRVDIADVAAFNEYWLERTDAGEPAEDDLDL